MKHYGARIFWFFVGVLIISFGVAFITKASLGTSAVSSVPYVLSLQFPVTMGQFTFCMNLFFFLLQLALLRRDFPPLQLLQMAGTLLFSSFLDVSMVLLSWLQPETLVQQLAALLVGTAILALGVALEVAPNILMVPTEGIVAVAAQLSGRRFGTLKAAFDITMVLTAIVLSLLFFHRLQGVGGGTVISALLAGRLVNLYNSRLPFLAHIAALGREAEKSSVF